MKTPWNDPQIEYHNMFPPFDTGKIIEDIQRGDKETIKKLHAILWCAIKALGGRLIIKPQVLEWFHERGSDRRIEIREDPMNDTIRLTAYPYAPPEMPTKKVEEPTTTVDADNPVPYK